MTWSEASLVAGPSGLNKLRMGPVSKTKNKSATIVEQMKGTPASTSTLTPTSTSTPSREGTPKRKSTADSADMNLSGHKQRKSGQKPSVGEIVQRTKKAKASVAQAPIEIDLEQEPLPKIPEVKRVVKTKNTYCGLKKGYETNLSALR